MFKPVPGNEGYLISIDGDIVERKPYEECGKRVCTLPYRNEKINISLYGDNGWFEIDWLKWLAYYEIRLPTELKDSLLKIKFVKVNRKGKNRFVKALPVFRKPIVIQDKYRLVPCFPRYAVGSDGEVLDIYTGLIENIHFNHYKSVFIYDPYRNRKREVALHLLLAEAWVTNPDIHVNDIVNHIDGDKWNNDISNLEWTTFTGNLVHAFENDLRTDNIQCKVRDVFTGEIKKFASLSSAGNFMKSRNCVYSLNKHNTPNKLINGRYELRIGEDHTPWFYEKHVLGTKAGRYTILIRDKEGLVKEYPDVRTFKKLFGVWNVSSIYDLIARAEKLYPDLTFSFEDHYHVGEVQAYKLDTREVFEATGMKPLIRLIKSRGIECSINSFKIALKKNGKKAYKGFLVRYKTDEPWALENHAINEYQSKCILAENIETKETIRFDSLRHAERVLKVSRDMLKNRIKIRKPVGNFLLHYC